MNNKDNSPFKGQLASYMAGLLESDGAIVIKKENYNGKEYDRVLIKFAFNKDDLYFAQFLRNLFNAGVVNENRDSYSADWVIYAIEDVYKFLLFINGYLRTAKIVTLKKAFNILNLKYNLSAQLQPLDSSNFLENGWLAGFSDGDSSFQITLYEEKNKLNTFQIKPYYQLEVSEFYLKDSEEYLEYRDNRIFMSPLAKTFNVNLLQRTRPASKWHKKEKYKLKINIIKTDTINLLINYLTNFPLFSSKYLNYLTWKEIVELKQNTKLKGDKLSTIFNQVEQLRNEMNSKRNIDNTSWSHLSNFFPFPKDSPKNS